MKYIVRALRTRGMSFYQLSIFFLYRIVLENEATPNIEIGSEVPWYN